MQEYALESLIRRERSQGLCILLLCGYLHAEKPIVTAEATVVHCELESPLKMHP